MGVESGADADLVTRLRVVTWRLHRRSTQEVGLGVTASQLSVLVALAECGPSRLGELAEREAVAAPSMTRIAASLQARGLVERSADSTDGRSFRLALAPAGREVLERVRGVRQERLARRVAALDEGQLAALRAALPVLEVLAGRG